ncbi:hypothetical protein BFX40_10240 [Mesorhizobium sp. SEMIA 3007]|uniref:hypothetical protein n=1 Tax=Mesorhizobium sp. SEMIA 3007 TaxID=1862350 RepID=UPI00083D243A|nr:hypothetical protein [Mesorhizobium sp. SEMIA 3007]ODA93221.1 hypothetical protein BFX40_10240 [Mesorhizobium sp. SEMIA 3007]
MKSDTQADGETPPPATSEPANLAAFVASLSSAWRAGESARHFSIEAKARYLRSLQKFSTQTLIAAPTAAQAIPPIPAATAAQMQEKPTPVYAEPGQARVQALRMVSPIVCRRLEEFPQHQRHATLRGAAPSSFQVDFPTSSTENSFD